MGSIFFRQRINKRPGSAGEKAPFPDMVAPTLATYLTYTQRVMGEVLTRDEKPHDIWNQHGEILQAIIEGSGARAETLARAHITQAAGFMVARLRGQPADRARNRPPAGTIQG